MVCKAAHRNEIRSWTME